MNSLGFRRKWLSFLKPSMASCYPYCDLSKHCVVWLLHCSRASACTYSSCSGLQPLASCEFWNPSCPFLPFPPMTLTFWKIQVCCLLECHICQVKLPILGPVFVQYRAKTSYYIFKGCEKEKEEKEGKEGGGGGRRIM